MSFQQIQKPTTTETKKKDNISKYYDLSHKDNSIYQQSDYKSNYNSVGFNFSDISINNTDNVIQRKPACTCGGKCSRCKNEENTPYIPNIQTKLKISRVGDPLEREADKAAEQVVGMNHAYNDTKFSNKNKGKVTKNRNCSICDNIDSDDKEIPIKISKKNIAYNNQNIEISNEIDNKINNVINSSGKPVDSSTQKFMESRFGYDFSKVRIHDDSEANELSGSINARAFTAGNNIFIGKNESVFDKKLIAHELTHVIQQSNIQNKINVIMRQEENRQNPPVTTTPQPSSPVTTTPQPVKDDFLFIMGKDEKNKPPFFALAKRFYEGKYPNAKVRNDIFNLEDVLSYVNKNTTNLIGKITIVAHGNMDGTLQIRLNSTDTTTDGVRVNELRDALDPASNSSLLTNIPKKVDSDTRIEIKGCNIGRNQAMVELIDQAFGGFGEVNAPTHEQRYRQINKTTPVREALSGPLFHKPGTNEFKRDELKPQVAKLYPHLSEGRRRILVEDSRSS